MNNKKINIAEADKISIWVLTDNYYDALRPDGRFMTRFRTIPGKYIHAEHGLAYYLETVIDGKTSGCMFDYGLDPNGVMNNIDVLGLDLGKASAFGLSHGHFDHWTAAVSILKKNKSKIAEGTPFYVGEETFLHRYAVRPGGNDLMDIGQLKKEDIENIGLKVIEIKTPTQLIPSAYLTGNIDRITPYEKVPPSLLVKRGDKPEPDDFRGEQALFFVLKGKGLVVLSGCAHAGIVNTVRHAQQVAGIEKVYAILGGFHLINAKPDIIEKTISDIKAIKPDYIAPTHCTGFEATVSFSREMPGEFNLNTAGTNYTFTA
ncbi:MAG: MBL fold metallo-hydrolase [Spirochaetes bacterium]|nr:MBL fold metallo-hydrolase [Spirochaetota bacterium]